MHAAVTDPRTGLYLGLMSGTSADGIDAALVEFTTADGRLAPHVLAAASTPYPASVRERVLTLAQADRAFALDDYGRLDVAIGTCFASAASALLRACGVDPGRVHAIGSHGQTVRHRIAGERPFTLQIGDPSVIAERTGITTIADFRRADVAAGGQGAPLLPALHAAAFASPSTARAVLNLGGIANLTLLDPHSAVTGFDTGPANCLLDAWVQRQRGTPRDDHGAWARSGHVDAALLARLLADPWFDKPAPKSTGREYFNLAWLEPHLPPTVAAVDVQATLLALTAQSIAAALHRHAPTVHELHACGGGVHNDALMDELRAALPAVAVGTTAALGVDPDYVEAIGFAWLARARLCGQSGNLPSVTGARGPRLLGAIYAAPSLPMSR